ncbi:MAG: adenylate/guanylate cyclase domain-containing protein [Chloroflexi bacterium]|nr:adenylate/guanylate cyclase domain-containing protein [Chloroflexota bacterium]
MSEQQVLEEAIAVLRKHQEALGYSVVETAVSVLLDQLSTLETSPLIEQFESVTVLQMDLSGFTALSAAMDAEQVRDRVNALWKRLDKVVLAWGGQIEQHTGDGLIALFGVPTRMRMTPNERSWPRWICSWNCRCSTRQRRWRRTRRL